MPIATPEPTRVTTQFTAVPTMAMGGMGLPDSASTPGTPSVSEDLTYIDSMIPHHQLAVDMAEIAKAKAIHGELKGLADDIIKAQKDEISRMGAWRRELTRSATPGAQGAGTQMAGMEVDLEKLKASQNFDHDFLVAMIPHHQSAIDMSRAALARLTMPGLHDMAQDVITTQQVEIDRMNGWLAAWK